MIRIALLIVFCASSACAQQTANAPAPSTAVTKIGTPNTTKTPMTPPSATDSSKLGKYLAPGKFRFETKGDKLVVQSIERDGKKVSFLDVDEPVDLGGGVKIVDPTAKPEDGTIDYQIGEDKAGNPLFIRLVLKNPPAAGTEPKELKEKIAKLGDPRVQQCGSNRRCTRMCRTSSGREYCCEYTCTN